MQAECMPGEPDVYLPWAEMCAFGGPGTVSLTQAVQ